MICIYGQCRARNLCKGSHCVGEALEKDGYIFKDGTIVKKEEEACRTASETK